MKPAILNPRDCEYVGYCEKTNKFIVHEQLYPESRGFIVHEFDTEEEALEAVTWK